MALTKVSGPLLHGSNDNLGNYIINNITGAAATFTGNVSVGGTLTYDDVTNVESVGIVTAKGGLHVGAGGTIIHALSEDNGKVGIGSAVPTAKLEVRGSGSNTTLNFLTKDVNRNNVFWAQDGGRVGVHYSPFVINQDTTDTATPSGTYFYVHHTSNPFIIKNDGKVGIGSITPGAALEVNGGTSYDVAIFNTEHADGPLIPIQKAGSNIGFLGSGKNLAPATGGATDLALRSQNELIFTSGGGVEKLRIESGGNVRVSDEHLRFDTTGKGIIFGIDGGSNRPSIIGNYTSSSDNNMAFNVTGSERLSITSTGNIGINSTSPNSQFVVNRSLTENNGIEMGYSSSSGGLHFIQAYNRSTSAFTKLVLNNSIGISTGGKVEFTADVNPVAEFDRGSANNTNLNLKYNGNFYGQVSVANTDFQLSAVGSNTNITIFTNGSSRAKFTSVGQFLVGTDPNANSGNIAHIEAPTTFNNGETIVEIAGDNAAAGPRLTLRNRKNLANTSSEILGSDSGGQSTGSVRFYHTDQSNNYGDIALGTRDAAGPPTDRFRITSSGSAAYKSSTMDNTAHIKVQSSAGADGTVQYILIAPVTTNNVRLMGEFHFTRAAGTSGVSEQVVEVLFLLNHANSDEQYYVKTKSTSGTFNGIEYEWIQLEYSGVDYYALRSVPRNGNSYWGAYMQHGFFKGTTNACADLGTVLNSSSHTVSNISVLTAIKNFEASNRVRHVIKQGTLYVQAHSANNAANFVPSYIGVDDAALPVTLKSQSQKAAALELNRMYSHGELLQFKQNNANTGYINTSGSATNHVTSGSDIRLKKDIEDWTEEVLPYFKSLKPQKFRFNIEDGTAEKTKGYMAQDNLDKFPEAYPLNPQDDRYWFTPSNMIPYLMKALQEEIVKREEIEAKYNALEARISALEGS